MFKGKFGAFGLAAAGVMCVFGLAMPGSVWGAENCEDIIASFDGELNANNVECICELRNNKVTCTDERISMLGEGAFKKLARVYSNLEISYTKLGGVPNDVLSTYFTDITISDNKNMKSISKDAFSGLNIYSLFMDNNSLTSLPEGVFKGQTNMKTLSLKGNRFDNIDNSFFSGLNGLNYLYIGNNLINNLEKGAFDTLEQLSFLDISSNQLEYLSSSSFNKQDKSNFVVDATYNCLNDDNISEISNVLLHVGESEWSDFNNQRVCLTVDYNTPKSLGNVKHPVIARLALTGNEELVNRYKDKIEQVNTKQLNWSSTSGSFNSDGGWRFRGDENGIVATVDVSSLSEYSGASNASGIVNFPTSGKVTANVDWIIPNVIRYAAKGGTEVENQTGYYDDEILNLETTRTGYNFSGWYYTGDDGTEKEWDFTGADVISYDKVIKEGENSGDIDLFAKWNAIEYTLNLDFDGGKCVSGENCWNETGVYFDSVIPNLPAVEKTGYTFDHYYTGDNKNNIITGGETPYQWPENSTGKVAWTANHYEINLDYVDGTGDIEKVDVTFDSEIGDSLPVDDEKGNKFKSGYTLTGWYLSGGEHNGELITGGTIWEIASGAEAVAQYKANEYEIEFDYGSGSFTGENESIKDKAKVIFDSEIGDLPDTYLTGYTFTGWKIGETEINTGTKYTWPKNSKAVAQYEANEYKITFDYGSGSFTGTKNDVQSGKTVTFDSEIGELPDAYLTGYDFSGWEVEIDGEKKLLNSTDLYKIPRDVIVKAKYEPHEWQISFDYGSGTSDNMTLKVIYDEAISTSYGSLPKDDEGGNKFLSGYTLVGWILSGGADSGMVIKDETIYRRDENRDAIAQYEPNKYTITFDLTGGSYSGDNGLNDDKLSVTFDSKIGDLPDASRTGYTFSGWYTGDDTTNLISAHTLYTWPEDSKATALWDANEYKLNFDFNDGTGNDEQKSIVYDTVLSNELPEATRTGYTFSGWSVNGNYYTGGDKYREAQDSTGLANWNPNTYVINFELNDGTGEESMDVVFDTKVELPVPTRKGYTFTGWTDIDSGSLVETGAFTGENVYNIATGLNLSAGWKANPYKITFKYEGGACTGDCEGSEFMSVTFDEKIGLLPNASRTGYSFSGWMIDGDYITGNETVYNWDSNKDAIAQWNANNQKIKFFVENPEALYDELTGKYDSVVPVADMTQPMPTKEGYTLVWCSDLELTHVWNLSTDKIHGDLNLYARRDEIKVDQGGRSGGGSRRATPSQSTDYEGEVNSSHGSAVDENDEYHIAHQWAYEKGLTSFENFDDARMFEDLTRAEMAKISSIFATKFYDKIPDTSAEKSYACSQYADLQDVNEELQGYIIQSCELGYMGYLSNGIDYLTNFRPNDKISRAEVAIVFSRIMWGNEYAGDENHWYEKHLQAMFDQGIIHNISTPFKNEMRGDVFIMLSRVDHVQ